MKKLLNLLLSLVVAGAAAAAGGGQARAAEPPRPAVFTLSVDREALKVGEELTATIGVASAAQLFGFKATVAFDPDRFEVVNVELLPAFGTGGVNAMLMQNVAAGQARLVAVRVNETRGVDGDVPVAKVRLKATAAATGSKLALEAGASYSNVEAELFRMTSALERSVNVTGASGAPGSGVVIPPGGGGGLILMPPSAPQDEANEGTAPTQVEIDANWIASERARGGLLVVNVPEAVGALEVRFPLGALVETGRNPEETVQIRSPLGGYSLPLSMFAALPGASGGASVTVAIQRVNGQVDAAMQSTAEAAGARLLTQGVDFEVRLTQGGVSTVLSDFGGNYVSRELPLDAEPTATATGVWYDPAKRTYRFVPTSFMEVNGTWTAVLRRPGNSVYAVASANKQFADMAGHWAEADVEALAAHFIVKGMTADSFAPEASVTRAQFASMLMQALSLSEAAEAAAFADVTAGSWYESAVGAVAKAGLISGYADGAFRPDRTITRQEIAVILSRALTFAGKPAPRATMTLEERYKDAASVPEWARAGVSDVAAAGLMGELSAGVFAGERTTTRAQAAVVLKRLLQSAEFIP